MAQDQAVYVLRGDGQVRLRLTGKYQTVMTQYMSAGERKIHQMAKTDKRILASAIFICRGGVYRVINVIFAPHIKLRSTADQRSIPVEEERERENEGEGVAISKLFTQDAIFQEDVSSSGLYRCVSVPRARPSNLAGMRHEAISGLPFLHGLIRKESWTRNWIP